MFMIKLGSKNQIPNFIKKFYKLNFKLNNIHKNSRECKNFLLD